MPYGQKKSFLPYLFIDIKALWAIFKILLNHKQSAVSAFNSFSLSLPNWGDLEGQSQMTNRQLLTNELAFAYVFNLL